MIDIIKNISNKIKGYYLLWIGLHLCIYHFITLQSYYSKTQQKDIFFPFSGQYYTKELRFGQFQDKLTNADFFDLKFYDSSELLFYIIAPVILYVAYKLITDSKEDE